MTMHTDIAHYPAPETLVALPEYHSIETIEMIECGRTLAKLRLLVSDAIRRKVFSEEEAGDLMRWIDSAEAL